MENIKEKIYEVLHGDEDNEFWHFIDIFIVILIFINIGTLIAETFSLSENIRIYLSYIETFSVIVFTSEYILRLWTADLIHPYMKPIKARLMYFFRFMSLVDLLAILPFFISLLPGYLKVLRGLRILRLVRLFKINRYTKSLTRIGNVIKRKSTDLLSSLLVVFLIMIIASVLMYNIENAEQPDKFNNAFSALWWSVSTFTTVGYGDICPTTTLGRILASVIAILGIGLVAVPTGIISSGFMEEAHEGDKSRKYNYCPHCGKKLN